MTVYKKSIQSLFTKKSVSLISVAKKSAQAPSFPTNLSLEWIDDFVRIQFTDNSNDGEHEIWEQVDGGGYNLVTTLSENITRYDYQTWQNADIDFKVRSKKNNIYSDFSGVESISSPLVFKMNQSILTPVDITILAMGLVGKTMVIDWGDNTTTNFSAVINTNVTHNYAATGNYFVKFGGDVDYIGRIDWYNNSAQLSGTNISKWIFPSYLTFGHIYNNGFTGDITNIVYPNNCTGLHLGGNDLIANITNWEFPVVYWDMHIQYNDRSQTTGDLSGWNIGGNNANTIAHLNIRGDISADLTDWRPWVSTPYGDILLNLWGNNFYGDLSGWTIPDKTANLTTYGGCKFTKLPRGNFRKCSYYRFKDNACDQSEIDAILAYIDAYFVGGVVPLYDCAYWFHGTGMGAPSAAGLASKASIEAKYIAAGKTATILTN